MRPPPVKSGLRPGEIWDWTKSPLRAETVPLRADEKWKRVRILAHSFYFAHSGSALKRSCLAFQGKAKVAENR